ncbi:MAG: response regulator [Calditrichaeota bacterium]|nr:MAG: response regulator [Calditrichota bacterium]MBL1203990.1 response regulator [Calditrichota bacterium]NOG43821.1 response regulator [Calditrichota bacterium]
MENQDQTDQTVFTILIVDDEQDVLDTIKEALTGPRYKIHCETNPVKAMELLENEIYDLVLTDLMMPEVGGMDLVNAIKTGGKDTSVIVITGHATLNTAIESIQLGVYDYVNKPINHKELQNLVFRATENLYLQRRNKELQRRNKRILANLSLLMDISKIIYQVTDLQSVFKMVIDTITEYFKLENCAIIMEDVQSATFKIVASNNLSKSIQGFEFKLPQIVNDVELSTQNESIIYVRNNEISFGEKKYSVEKNGWFTFNPISFHDQIMGFLMIQSEDEGTFPSSEIIAMLNILASQTAPMMFSLKFDGHKKPLMENDVIYMIRDSINKATDVLSPISFALLRMELNSPSGDPFSFQDMIRTSQSFMLEMVDKDYKLLWQSQDTALLIMPEMDYFNAEIYCKNLKSIANQDYSAKEPGASLHIHFSCMGYPEAGDTAKEITDRLWAKLLQEINSTKNDKLDNHLEA